MGLNRQLANLPDAITTDTSNNVGIGGAANASFKLQVTGSGAFNGGATGLILSLDANASIAKSISFRSNNSPRMSVEVSGSENGSNTGAKFQIKRFSDAGSLIDTPFEISRETGNSTFFSDYLFLAKNQNGFTNFYIENTTGGTSSGGSYIIRSDFGSDFAAFGKFSTLTSAIGIRSPKDAYLITDNGSIAILTSDATGTIKMAAGNSSTAHLTIASTGAATFSGNIAIAGAGLSAWGGTFGVMQSYYGSYFGGTSGGGTVMGNNNYFDGTNYKYINSDFAGQIQIAGGNILLRVAPSGTAGNNITYTNALTLASTGNATFSFTTSGYGITSKSTSNYSGILADTSTNTGGGYFAAAKNGTRYSIFGTTGAWLGDTSTDTAIVSEAASSNIKFYTNGSSTASMTITSGGDVYIGSTSVTTSNVSMYWEKSNGEFTQVFPYSSGTKTIQSYYRQSGASIGSITYNGTVTAYNSTSDYRLKEDFKDYNALNVISKLKTYDFKWKNTDVRDYGMMAHELQEILPNYVSGEKDEIYEDGTFKTQGVDYSKIVPILIKSIQELQEQINELKNK